MRVKTGHMTCSITPRGGTLDLPLLWPAALWTERGRRANRVGKEGKAGETGGTIKGDTARVSAEHQVDLPSSTSAPRALCVLIVTRGVRGSLHGGVQPPSHGLKIIYSRALWPRCRYSEVEGCNIWRF